MSDLFGDIHKRINGVISRTGEKPHELRMSGNTVDELKKLANYSAPLPPTDDPTQTLFGIPFVIDESIADGEVEPRYYYPTPKGAR